MILLLVVVSGLVFANREIKNETSKHSFPKPFSVAEREVESKKWEVSPEGKKVLAGAAKLSNEVRASSNISGYLEQ